MPRTVSSRTPGSNSGSHPRRTGSRVRFGIDTERQPHGDVVQGHPAPAKCGE
ncbi:hypothetical protein ACGFXB_23410 [Streptomyces canus]|uniref:hypothetical protein n=1 Tax=Streptomyces canus TaxID=58343 RepID=UPI00371B2D6C